MELSTKSYAQLESNEISKVTLINAAEESSLIILPSSIVPIEAIRRDLENMCNKRKTVLDIFTACCLMSLTKSIYAFINKLQSGTFTDMK